MDDILRALNTYTISFIGLLSEIDWMGALGLLLLVARLLQEIPKAYRATVKIIRWIKYGLKKRSK